MARLLALLCALAVCSAASGRLLLQDPTGNVTAGSETAPAASPMVGATENMTSSPAPMAGGAAMENMTASNPAVAESPAVGASGSDAANATAAPTLTYATFGEALTAANSTELGNLTILVAALNATGAGALINDTTAWTILAPNNAAFERAFTELNVTAAEVLAEPQLVTALLSYHVIPEGALLSTNLTNGSSYATALADAGNLTVLLADGNVTFVGNASNATVLTPNIKAGASVIHVIDSVLLPPLETEVANTTASPAPMEGMAVSPAPTEGAAGAANTTASRAPTTAAPAAEGAAAPAPEAAASPAP